MDTAIRVHGAPASSAHSAQSAATVVTPSAHLGMSSPCALVTNQPLAPYAAQIGRQRRAGRAETAARAGEMCRCVLSASSWVSRRCGGGRPSVMELRRLWRRCGAADADLPKLSQQ